MSYELEYYTLERFSDQGLSVMQCGYQISHSGHVSESRFYERYSVTFILKGKGTYRIGDRVYELCAGQGFLIVPNIAISYQADVEDPWEYLYVIFCGADSLALLRHAGLNEHSVIFDFSLQDDTVSNLFSLYSAVRTDASRGYAAVGHFYLVMSRIVQSALLKKEQKGNYVNRAVAYIEDHYLHNISADDVARSVNLDRTYLYRIFMKKVGCSPASYIRTCKLNRSLELMKQKDMTLSEIAVSSGFYDLSHFSRIFSEVYGMSPRDYRKGL